MDGWPGVVYLFAAMGLGGRGEIVAGTSLYFLQVKKTNYEGDPLSPPRGEAAQGGKPP